MCRQREILNRTWRIDSRDAYYHRLTTYHLRPNYGCIRRISLFLFFTETLHDFFLFFFLTDPPTPDIYPLPQHAALPISHPTQFTGLAAMSDRFNNLPASTDSLVNPFRYTARESDTETDLYYYHARYYNSTLQRFISGRSEEHTSELQSRLHLVCRLLLEK